MWYKKAVIYELLGTGIVGGPAQVLIKYHEKDIVRIRSHVYGEENKLKNNVLGYVAYYLYLYCSVDVMPCGKDTLAGNEKPFDLKQIGKIF